MTGDTSRVMQWLSDQTVQSLRYWQAVPLTGAYGSPADQPAVEEVPDSSEDESDDSYSKRRKSKEAFIPQHLKYATKKHERAMRNQDIQQQAPSTDMEKELYLLENWEFLS